MLSHEGMRRYAHLNSLSEIVAAALLLDDLSTSQDMELERELDTTYVLVDLAGGDVVVSGEGDGEVSLVVAEIEVDFGALRRMVSTPEKARRNKSMRVYLMSGRSTPRAQPGPSSLHRPRHRDRS